MDSNFGARPAGQARHQPQPVVEQGKQVAGQVVDKTRSKVKGQLETQMGNASSTLDTVAQSLLLTSGHLRLQGQDQISDYGDRAAEQLTKASNYLKQRGVDQVLWEAGDLARNRPTLVLGTAVTLGVLLARFLKSSGKRDSSMMDDAHFAPAVDAGTFYEQGTPYDQGPSVAAPEPVGVTAYVVTETPPPPGGYAAERTVAPPDYDAGTADAPRVRPPDGV